MDHQGSPLEKLKYKVSPLQSIIWTNLNAGDLGSISGLGGKIHWRRERLPILVFWPKEFHGLYSPWGHEELDMTERTSLSLSLY